MSVLVKARSGGADYIYSVLMGYEESPAGMSLDDGVYYNKYMIGNEIKMASPLSDGIVEYTDGSEATVDQMANDVTTFLAWAAEPELEARHKTGIKVIIYLMLLTILVYFSMKKIWSRIDSKV
jgi:ubiquinol-cytochrome c reductase cytochrome c1 subunit